MKKAVTLITAGLVGALGAGAMYIFDPDRGRRRRAMIARQFEQGRRRLSDAAGSAAQTLRHSTGDYGGALRSALSWNSGASRAERVGERVRARLGGMTQTTARSTRAHKGGSTGRRIVAVLAGTGIGGIAWYLLDPQRGARRRALLRDQVVHGQHTLADAAQATTHDVRKRTSGYGASLRSAFSRATGNGDTVVSERVRAAIGRAVTHPGSIEVSVDNGVVTLSGPVLAREVPLLMDRVLDVRGVRDLTNRLEVHQQPGSIPGLQGGTRMVGGEQPQFLQRNWSPAARLVAGVAGAGASARLFRRGLVNKALGIGGMALLTRAATNMELRQLTGVGAKRHAVSVQKTININAPLERVFELWSRPENYPQFMTHVREVRPLGGAGRTQRWHWKVQGTTGMEFEFDTLTTGYEENRFIAWRTEPGAWVQHSGQVRFQSSPERSTTATVMLSYNPVASAVGHVIAKLLGDDPKSQLDDDLLRMKSYLETGVRPHDAAAGSRPEF